MFCRTYLDTPFGLWALEGSERGLRTVRLVPSFSELPEAPVPEPLREAVRQLEEYFRRERQVFDLPLDLWDAPAFYRSVWDLLREVPYGRTTSYSSIAHRLGKPGAVRAVGQANAGNPLAIVIPCHRCLAKSGDLRGYFYGLDMKRALLAWENPAAYAQQGGLF
ncbi:MAG: hypothetical protein RLY31_158 [Bacteroidota bacterium]|jgi:methylated-DNA-[protein]-cysteine S-methyltransferase